jgi:hypothetical protein
MMNDAMEFRKRRAPLIPNGRRVTYLTSFLDFVIVLQSISQLLKYD